MKMNLPWPSNYNGNDSDDYTSFDALEDLDEVQNLPFKESRKEFLTRKYGDMWDMRRFDHSSYRSDKSLYPWVKARRVIKKFLGKPFDDAFSYYCTLVPQHQQEEFLEQFEEIPNKYHFYGNDYIVDKNRCIKLNPNRYKREPTPPIIYSDDYELKYRRIIPSKRFFNIITAQEYNSLNYDYSDNHIKMYGKAQQKDFDPFVFSGSKQVFESKHVKTYIRAKREKIANSRRERIKAWKAKNNVVLSFLTQDELQKRMDWKEGILVRDRHGFDENSFKGDPYHGQQRKVK